MSHDTLRRLVSDAYNTQSAGMTVGLPRVSVDASQLRALIAHHDSLKAERDAAIIDRALLHRARECLDREMPYLDSNKKWEAFCELVVEIDRALADKEENDE